MLYSFLALITGANIAVAILLNARLGAIKSVYKSAFVNYTVGLIVSFPLALIITGGWLSGYIFELKDLLIMTGGIIGAVIVVANNHITPKIGILYVTILLFIGQIGAGSIIDAIRDNSFSFGKTIGGLLIVAGLVYLVRMEKTQQ